MFCVCDKIDNVEIFNEGFANKSVHITTTKQPTQAFFSLLLLNIL